MRGAKRDYTPFDDNQIVQGLWVGPTLSVMEQLSISSFLLKGHDYHLYVYERPANVPVGTVLMDASEILPASAIFQYTNRPTYAGFADSFRYKLLLEVGGWWADTDVVCLKPFNFSREHVFSTQQGEFEDVATSCVIKAPAGSRAMAYAWSVCQSKEPARLNWGEIGPALMEQTVARFGLERDLESRHVFCPLSYGGWDWVLRSDAKIVLDERAYAIHLWNELWRLNDQDKNAEYPSDSLYEQLKARYLRLPRV